MKTVPVPSRSSICEVVATLMRDGEASLPKAALALGLSPRSLQRRLSDTGTSFSELVAEVRLDTACHLLRKSDLSLATIASRLGYNSPADLADHYPKFFWSSVEPYVGPALKYLDRTIEGKRWVAQLYAHVFVEEHRRQRPGPQRQ